MVDERVSMEETSDCEDCHEITVIRIEASPLVDNVEQRKEYMMIMTLVDVRDKQFETNPCQSSRPRVVCSRRTFKTLQQTQTFLNFRFEKML